MCLDRDLHHQVWVLGRMCVHPCVNMHSTQDKYCAVCVSRWGPTLHFMGTEYNVQVGTNITLYGYWVECMSRWGPTLHCMGTG